MWDTQKVLKFLTKRHPMTQIEEIAKFVFRPGMSEQDFFQQIYAELRLRNLMVRQKISRDQAKKWLERRAKGLVVCPYEQEWTKGLYISNLFMNEPVKITKHPADVHDILNHLYHYRRYTNFPEYTDNEKKMMRRAMGDTKDIHEHEEGGFYFRILKGWRKTHHSFARFQINADMNPKIIQVLDGFLKRHNSTYKMPSPDEWSGRTDTVNIYMYEPVTEDIKKEIVQILSPYIRRSKPSHINSIDGEILADGIGFAREVHHEECKPLVSRYPVHLKRDVQNYLNSGVSLGTLRVTKEFLDMYQRYAPKFRANAGKNPIQPSKTISKIHKKEPLISHRTTIRTEIMRGFQSLYQGIDSLQEQITTLDQRNKRLLSRIKRNFINSH